MELDFSFACFRVRCSAAGFARGSSLVAPSTPGGLGAGLIGRSGARCGMVADVQLFGELDPRCRLASFPERFPAGFRARLNARVGLGRPQRRGGLG